MGGLPLMQKLNGVRAWLVAYWTSRPIYNVVLPVIGAMALGVAGISVYLPEAMQAAAIDSAYRGSIEVADQIKITRGYYTRNVVAKALASGAFEPSYDHKDNPKAIPLPATFVKDISDLLAKKDLSLSLISPYPWPHRADRVMDEFQTAAWTAFQKDPTQAFSRQEIRDGKRILRTAVADIMTGETCVSCHNTHPQSIRRDWKVGDVRAVMEVTKLVEPYLAASDQRSRMITWSLQAAAGFVAIVLLIGGGLVAFRTREKKLADQNIHYLARHDPMTGCLNRATFTARLRETMESQRRDMPVALYYLDLDRFKEANDRLGHAIGDLLIKAVCERISGLLVNGDLLSRFGGDEFVIAQTGLCRREDAQTLAANIVQVLALPFAIENSTVSISVSVGVVIRSDKNESADDLINAADIALYKAKAGGRDRYVIFEPDMRQELAARRELERKIRDAARQRSFELYFQPLCNAATFKIEGFEALLRLKDSSDVFVPPSVFIPIAEQIGVIGDVGQWVIESACAAAALWPDGLRVAVNLSPEQFKATGHGKVIDIVQKALADSGLDPCRLELEITEGLLLDTSDSVIEELHALRRLGISLVMDDFGSGYSSLSYLWKLPIDKLKIDRSFAAACLQSHSTIVPILRSIAALARTLGLRITAEGIETQEQIDLFAPLQCDQYQGYYFGHPMAEIDLPAAILKSWHGRRAYAPAQSAVG
jgi:diguanylate cyclase (GGDEF)-like protein